MCNFKYYQSLIYVNDKIFHIIPREFKGYTMMLLLELNRGWHAYLSVSTRGAIQRTAYKQLNSLLNCVAVCKHEMYVFGNCGGNITNSRT